VARRGWAPDGRRRPRGWPRGSEALCESVGATGRRQRGPVHGIPEGVGPGGGLERQALLALLSPRLVRGGPGRTLALGAVSSGEPHGARWGGPVPAGLVGRGLAVLGACATWVALPAPAGGGHGRLRAGARPWVVVGWAGARWAKEPRRARRGMASKTQSAIGRALGLRRLAALRSSRRARAPRLRGHPLAGWLAGGRVAAPIGPLGAPLVGVRWASGEVPAGAQRPAGVPDVVAGAFCPLPVCLGVGHVAGAGGALAGPPKGPQGRVAPPQGPWPFSDRGAPVVRDACVGGPWTKGKAWRRPRGRGSWRCAWGTSRDRRRLDQASPARQERGRAVAPDARAPQWPPSLGPGSPGAAAQRRHARCSGAAARTRLRDGRTLVRPPVQPGSATRGRRTPADPWGARSTQRGIVSCKGARGLGLGPRARGGAGAARDWRGVWRRRPRGWARCRTEKP
jgi:hypothetical protein